MKHISVAIDGPAGAGKSTLARQAAQRLGVGRTTLYRKMKKYGIAPRRGLESGAEP